MNLDCEYISFDKQIKYFEVISESKKIRIQRRVRFKSFCYQLI